MPHVIGIDIGTTSTIGILLDIESGATRIFSRPVTLYSPHAGWAEEDPEEWWLNLCSITRALLEAVPQARFDLVGIGVAGMVPAVILLDCDGKILRPSIQQSDSRCGVEIDNLGHDIDPAEFLRRTGNGLNQQIVAAKLRWLETHEPGVFSRISTVFGSYDWIAWRLTGERGTERNWALEAGFTDVGTGNLADDLIALGHIPRNVIPPINYSHTVIGSIKHKAAMETGLPAGLSVIAGIADHVASAYAAGVVSEGDVLLKFGGAGDILLATTHAHPDSRVFLDYHAIPDLFMPNGCMASTGSLLNWLSHNFACPDGDSPPHPRLDALAAQIAPGSDGVVILPYFLGEKSPIHDPSARGTISGLSLSHNGAHIWRAALESAAYAFRHHIEVFREIGYPVRRLLASDGGANSAVWMQIVADTLQAPVQLLTGHPGSCLGAAWLAAVGTGIVADWRGVEQYIKQGRLVEPERTNEEIYEVGFRRFRALYDRLQPWFAA